MSKDLREWSKGRWLPNSSKPDIEEIQSGCLQRIADATEMMSKNHDALVRDRDIYKRLFRDSKDRIEQLERSNAALRGVITRLKKERTNND